MDIRQLRYFLHAAKTQNLTQASGIAWVSQSALSRQIKLLESELGVLLFERKARGLKLTESGYMLVSRAEQLLKEFEELKHAVSSTQQMPIGTLRIGTPTSLRSMLMVPFFLAYRQRYPNVLLVHKHGTSKGMRDALADGQLDIAISSDQEVLDSFAITPLLSESLCWVGPADANLTVDKPVSVNKIVAQPLILTSYPNSLRVIMDRQLTKLKLCIQPIAELDSAQMMLDLVSEGMGYTVLPLSGVQDAIKTKYVSAAPIRNLRIAWVMALSRERSQTIAASRAVEVLQQLCQSRVMANRWPTAISFAGKT
jgi:LysR family transcriptional regulator, nitrogen assimilation regulatory protein